MDTKGHCIFLTCCQNSETGTSPIRAIGAYACAHYLEENGYESDVVDYIEFFTTDQLVHIVSSLIRDNTLFIGISNTFLMTAKVGERQLYRESIVDTENRSHTYSTTLLNAIYLLKEKFPKIKIVIGGAKASYMGHSLIDCSIHGFAEDMVVEYADWLIGKNPFLKYSKDPKWTHMMVIKESNRTKFDIKVSNFRFKKNIAFFLKKHYPWRQVEVVYSNANFVGFLGLEKRRENLFVIQTVLSMK